MILKYKLNVMEILGFSRLIYKFSLHILVNNYLAIRDILQFSTALENVPTARKIQKFVTQAEIISHMQIRGIEFGDRISIDASG